MGLIQYTRKTNRNLLILVTIYSLLTINIYPGNSTFSYGELLNEADKNNKNLRFQFALDKIRLAGELNEAPGYHFFRVYGDSLLGLGRDVEALQYYRKSLELNKEQPELLIQVSNLYKHFNQPREEFYFFSRYLSEVPFNRELYYRMLVLASRIGKKDDYNKTLDEMNAQNPYTQDFQTIIKKITENIEAKEYKTALAESEKYLVYFPESEQLHSIRIRILLLQELDPRTALLEAAALDKGHQSMLRYGIYLYQQREYHEALAVTRRAFLTDLLQNGNGLNREILYYLRQIYHRMGKDYDARAATQMSSTNLEQLLMQDRESYDRIMTSFPDNREYLILFIYSFRQRNDKKNMTEFTERLKNRDDSMQWAEMLYGTHSFKTDNLLNSLLFN